MAIAIVSQGNHTPDKWALTTAQIIFDLDGSLAGSRLLQARGIQNQIAVILSDYYDDLIDQERGDLEAFFDHCDAPYNVHCAAMTATFDIRALLVGTPWEDKAADPEWVGDVARTIQTHLETAIHVERLLFADLNPTNPSAVAYRARFHGASI